MTLLFLNHNVELFHWRLIAELISISVFYHYLHLGLVLIIYISAAIGIIQLVD